MSGGYTDTEKKKTPVLASAHDPARFSCRPSARAWQPRVLPTPWLAARPAPVCLFLSVHTVCATLCAASSASSYRFGLSLRGATAASPSILSRQEASVVIDVLPCEHRQAPGAAGLRICRSEAWPLRERGEQRGLAADNLSHRRLRRAPILSLDTPCRSRRRETRS